MWTTSWTASSTSSSRRFSANNFYDQETARVALRSCNFNSAGDRSETSFNDDDYATTLLKEMGLQDSQTAQARETAALKTATADYKQHFSEEHCQFLRAANKQQWMTHTRQGPNKELARSLQQPTTADRCKLKHFSLGRQLRALQADK